MKTLIVFLALILTPLAPHKGKLNFMLDKTYALPNDPALPFQYYWSLDRMMESLALMPVTVTRVKVGIVDTGLILNHQDIDYTHVIWGCDHTRQGCFKPIDYGPEGHGLMVAGIIAAKQNNGIAITGGTNYADLIIEQVCNLYGCPLDAVAKGITHACDKGAKILSVAIESEVYSAALANAIYYCYGKGVLIIVPSGNTGKYSVVTPNYPAIFPQVMTVGGTDEQDHLWSLSGWGKVSVVAPAVHIFTLSNTNSTTIVQCNGTSCALAQVVALAANICAKAGGICKAGRLREIIEKTADNLGPSVTFGHGRIRADKAMLEPYYVRPGKSLECRPGSVC